MRNLILVSLAIVSLGSSACGSSDTTAATTGAPAPFVCSKTTATDMTTAKTVTIDFGGTLGTVYKPNCITVAAGTTVTFAGDFSFHPLTPGTVDASMMAHPSTTETVIMATSTGMTASFTFPAAGEHPYYCSMHFAEGMTGDIFVK